MSKAQNKEQPSTIQLAQEHTRSAVLCEQLEKQQSELRAEAATKEDKRVQLSTKLSMERDEATQSQLQSEILALVNERPVYREKEEKLSAELKAKSQERDKLKAQLEERQKSENGEAGASHLDAGDPVTRSKSDPSGANYRSPANMKMGWQLEVPQDTVQGFVREGGALGAFRTIYRGKKIEGAIAEACERDAEKEQGLIVPVSVLAGVSHFRDITSSGSSTAIGTMATSNIEEILRPQSAIMQLGLTPQMVKSRVRATYLSDGAAVDSGAVLEDADVPEGQRSVKGRDLVALRFHQKEKISIEAKAEVIGIEQALYTDMLRKIELQKDWQFIFQGTADTTNNRNIKAALLNLDNIAVVSIGANGGAITSAHVNNLQAMVHDNNANPATCKWIMSHATFARLRSSSWNLNSGATYVTSQAINMPGGGSRMVHYVLGNEAILHSGIPRDLTKGTGTNLTAIMYIDTSKIHYAMFMGLQIWRNMYSDADSAAEAIHMVTLCDLLTNHPTAMGAIKDISNA